MEIKSSVPELINVKDLHYFINNATNYKHKFILFKYGFPNELWLPEDIKNIIIDKHILLEIQLQKLLRLIAEQLSGMETGSWIAAHGKSASWQNLIDSLDTYINLYNQSKRGKAIKQWNRNVGSAQTVLPVHVVNEYCHPDRSFEPCPNFKDTTPIPRSRQTDRGEWFTANYKGGRLGDGVFANVRKGGEKCRQFALGTLVNAAYVKMQVDRKAIATLLAIREKQQQDLFVEYLGNKSQTQFKLK